MTTNTARNAAATATAVGQHSPGEERSSGTSVLLHGLTRSFGATRALDGLSIEMAPGELVALLGPSGCGVLLLDEPLSALDAKVRLQLREQIRLLQQQLGTTTLFVTHDQEEALSMADRVGVMSNGRLEQIAAPDELYTNPATAFVAEFVGVMNRLPGELRDGGMVTALGSTVPVRGESQGDPAGTAVDVLVRPESLAMEAAEHGNGIVTTRTFLGSVTRVGVQLDGDVAVQVDRPSAESAALAPGASVQVSLPGQPVLVTPRRG